jgi:hypothetical protein
VRFLKEYWVYVLIILVLVLAICFSIFKTSQKTTENKNNQSIPKTKITKDNGDIVEVKNVYGWVTAWDSKSKILKVEISKGNIKEFEINPENAKVMVPMSRRGTIDNQFFVLKNASGKHWETAFCLGDNASIQVNNEGKVEMAVNDGRRMCGFMGAWE